MGEKFEVELLPEAVRFIENLNVKTRQKILFNIRKAQFSSDPELFKKLTDSIWEFRTLYDRQCIRLFAFWDKSESKNTLVIVTNGLIKKASKTPKEDLLRAEKIRQQYLNQKK